MHGPSVSEQSTNVHQEDQLRIAATGALRRTGHPVLARLDVAVTGATVVLRGVLPSFYLKQLAQECVLDLEEVKGVQNLIVVEYST